MNTLVTISFVIVAWAALGAILLFLVTWGDAMTILLMIGVLVATSFCLGYLIGYETSGHGHQWKP